MENFLNWLIGVAQNVGLKLLAAILTWIIGSIIITLTVGAVLLPVMGLFTWEHLTSPLFLACYIPFGLLFFFISVWGDLAGSLIKRGLAVKDSGSLLPGIGGIFDLIDSPAFTVSFSVCVCTLVSTLLCAFCGI
jgi:phosphatidate cytidylyltransferase